MRATWGISGGLSGRESWAQKREDAKNNALFEAENTRILDTMNQERLLAEEQTQGKLDELNNLPAGAPDQKRLKEQYDKEKANLISSMAQYGGDMRKWMMSEGQKQLGNFKRNFESSDAYMDALTNKGSLEMMTKAIANGAYVGPVTVKVKEDRGGEEVVVTKKMQVRDAIDAYQKGDILSMDGVTAEKKIKVNWNDPWFVNNAMQPDGTIKRVTADDLMSYLRTNFPEASQEQRMEIANEYANYVNEGLKIGEDRGFVPGMSDREKYGNTIERYNIEQGNREARLNTSIQRQNQQIHKYSESSRQSQRSGQSTGSAGSPGGTAGQYAKGTKNETYGQKVDRYVNNPSYVGGDGDQTSQLLNNKEWKVALGQMSNIQPAKDEDNNYSSVGGTPNYIAIDQKIVMPYDKDGNRVSSSDMNDLTSTTLQKFEINDWGGYTYFTDSNGLKRVYRKAYIDPDKYGAKEMVGELTGVDMPENYVWIMMPDQNDMVVMDQMAQDTGYKKDGSIVQSHGRNQQVVVNQIHNEASNLAYEWLSAPENMAIAYTEEGMRELKQFVESNMANILGSISPSEADQYVMNALDQAVSSNR